MRDDRFRLPAITRSARRRVIGLGQTRSRRPRRPTISSVAAGLEVAAPRCRRGEASRRATDPTNGALQSAERTRHPRPGRATLSSATHSPASSAAEASWWSQNERSPALALASPALGVRLRARPGRSYKRSVGGRVAGPARRRKRVSERPVQNRPNAYATRNAARPEADRADACSEAMAQVRGPSRPAAADYRLRRWCLQLNKVAASDSLGRTLRSGATSAR